jgi:hypothetical protein
MQLNKNFAEDFCIPAAYVMSRRPIAEELACILQNFIKFFQVDMNTRMSA